jgi:tetratricopeptide (TPR) repeat protein
MDPKNKNEKPLSPEIAKLAEKLSKDPKSRLFVPLAEEYLKSGMPEEAVIVLTDGLKIHPNFHAARAMLGRIYLDKGQIAEAKTEFEAVIKTDPENLLAHRKLARIYKNTGQLDKARTSCQAVLMSSSKDSEMTLLMGDLDRIQEAERARLQERPAVSMESAPPEMQVEQTSHAVPELKAEPGQAAPPPEPAADSPEPAGISSPSPEPVLESPPAPSPGPAAASPEPSGAENKDTFLSLEDILGQPEAAPAPAPEASSVPEAGTVQTPEPPADGPPETGTPAEEITTEALADLYIKQGNYEKGIAMYRRLLAKEPSNQALFRKLEESVELARVLTEGPQIKKNPVTVPDASPVSAEPPPSAPAPEPVPEQPAVPTDREQQKMQKIQRLQHWLDSIKKGQGR